MECVGRRSRAQYSEDVHLLPLLLEATGGARGVFVEMGALDGFDKSNTYALERCLGWDGVLIEAEAAPSTAFFVGALLAGTLAWIAVDFGRGASAPAPRGL